MLLFLQVPNKLFMKLYQLDRLINTFQRIPDLNKPKMIGFH